MKPISRRTLLAAPFALGGAAFGADYWCRHVEAENLEVTTKPVALPELRRPVRLLHIADFHLEAPEELPFLERAFAAGRALTPDLICISGDFITDGLIDQGAYAAVLRKLTGAAPVYAVTGNHDGGVWSRERKGYADSFIVRRLLDDSGIECLHNRAVTIEIAGQPLHLTGIADLWSGESRPARAFAGTPAGVPHLAMAHNPDYKEDLAPYPWHLLLAGHTHGGQWRLPLIDWAPYVPVKDRRFLEGLHGWNGRQIHVTRGVGSILHSRLNCRPEVSLLELRAPREI
jgi:hypothetical protein